MVLTEDERTKITSIKDINKDSDGFRNIDEDRVIILDKIINEYDQLIIDKDQLVTEKQQLVTTNSDLESQRTSLSNQQSTLETAQTDLQRQLAECETNLSTYLNEKQSYLDRISELEAKNSQLTETNTNLNQQLTDLGNGEPSEITQLKSNINSITQEMTNIMEKVTNDNKEKFLNTYFQPSTRNGSDMDNNSAILTPKTTQLDLGEKTSSISNLIFANSGQLLPSNVEVNLSSQPNSDNSTSNINAKITFTKQNVAYVENLTTSVSSGLDNGMAHDHI